MAPDLLSLLKMANAESVLPAAPVKKLMKKPA
jgi:hypothetical protein